MIATASAAATPDSPDVSVPSQPSGLSSAKRPVLSASLLRNEVTVSPGSSAAWATLFRIGENFNVGSNGFAAGLRSGGPHFRAAVVDGRGAPAGAGRRREQGQGRRAGTAELADPRHPDRQLFQEPVRAAAIVLRPDRAGDALA